MRTRWPGVVHVPGADRPTIDPTSAPYWEAAREGRLLIAACGACGRKHHYPRPMCPFCWSDQVEPIEASGHGRLYSYSVIHANDLPPFRDRLPYIAALVELAIEGATPDELVLDMAVTAVFRPLDPDEPDGAHLTVFTPTRLR